MRFPMRIVPMFRPVAMLFAASSERSFVQVTDASVRVRYGFFDETIARDDIAAVQRYEPRWWHGLGWRYWPRHVLLLGAQTGCVSIALVRSRRVALFPFLPRFVPVTRITVSVEDPDGLMRALGGG
jgi:hypothetical protein